MHQLDYFTALYRVDNSNEGPQQSEGLEVFSFNGHSRLIPELSGTVLVNLFETYFYP